MKKGKMLYIGHSYHLRTMSTRFLVDLFKEAYDVYEMSYDMEESKFDFNGCDAGIKYEILVVFQVFVPPSELRSMFKFKKAAFFPMYDGAGYKPPNFWESYIDFNIINFSSTLHNRLLEIGMSSHHIQYFPKPMDNFKEGELDSAFFWQRIDYVTMNTIAPIIRKLRVEKVHLHKVCDPGHHNIEPEMEVLDQFNISISEWFESSTKMLNRVEDAAIYIAPRMYEGIGMSFLEAMAMGRCVVAINHPTMNEYITDGCNGILYAFEHPELMESGDIRRIQKNAYDSIVDGYAAWERNKRDILKWIQQKVNVDSRKLQNALDAIQKSKSYYIGNRVVVTKDKEGTFYVFGMVRIPVLFVNVMRRIYRMVRVG